MHLKTDSATAQSHFASVPTITHSRNAFTVAEKHVTTMQFDQLYPLYWKMIYPGDTLSVAMRSMARLQTQIGPLYDDLYMDVHAWFVPLRLIQTNWARFQFNAQPGGPSQDNSALTTPNIDLVGLGAGGFGSKSLYDYLGYPTKINLTGTTAWIHNYPARAYALIWNQNYRDENIQSPATVDLTEGPDTASNYALLTRGKRHDKFTSCLPFQQKGTAVTIPLGTTAPVRGIGVGNHTFNLTNVGVYESGAANPTYANAFKVDAGTPANDTYIAQDVNHSGFPGIYADLTSATAATLNLLRQSVAIQHLLEADARGGTRDVESIQHRWGVTVPDFRLQRPEYLGGQTWTFDGHIVPQTSATSGSNYQAGLAQFSQAMSQFSVSHSFVEHGIFMILFSARSNITYQQGCQKDLSYKTRFDFYQPEFANLGEVAVLNKEIYMDTSDTDNNGTFGFQEYGYELRYSENRVSGEMRSNYSTPLDSRHMADDYLSLPTLGNAWIQSNTPISRNIAVSAGTADPIQMNAFLQGKIARCLPMYSIPGLDRL